MKCEGGDWTARFPTVPGQGGSPEYRPLEMNFQLNRRDFDFCRGTFDTVVGDQLMPHTRTDGGELRQPTIVEICFDGDAIRTLVLEPNNANYGSQATHLEFTDAQKLLDSGVVDMQREDIKLRDAYQYAFDKRENHGIIKGLKFAIPDDIPQEILARQEGLVGFGADHLPYGDLMNKIQAEGNRNARLIDGTYVVDLDEVSPLKAILKLNNLYHIISWVGDDQYLWVGTPEALAQQHVAAPDDDRVWRYDTEEVQIRHPREPVAQVRVEGTWVDEPGQSLDAGEFVDWFNPFNEKGGGDVRATGVAYRTDIDYGQTLGISSTGAKRDVVADIAESALIEKMKEANSGTVQIQPSVSGNYTAPVSTRPGDILHMVPDDDHFDSPTVNSGTLGNRPEVEEGCHGFVYNELYFIQGVQHDVDDAGHWTMTLDVAMYPDEPTESVTRYFNPRSDELLTEEDVFENYMPGEQIE